MKKAATADEKSVVKLEKEGIQLKFGYALIDGRMEKMGNFNMEPPGLFRGRGEHPKTGMVKQRCYAESVSINVSEDACPPICTLPGMHLPPFLTHISTLIPLLLSTHKSTLTPSSYHQTFYPYLTLQRQYSINHTPS